MKNQVELLAPAGDWEAFTAAVENGADAVYLGGRLLNARQFAANFDTEQLKKALEYAHVRDTKIYLTMNTLVADSEMKEAVDFAEEAYLLGIDGIIVQDIGLAGLLRKLYPGLELHASTQMTVYNLEGVKVLEELGFKRAVLARELSIDEIGRIAKNTPLEIEVFIHGALCISYSGQCLMSSIIGGRSGNRGKCAQPCRLPYELVSEAYKSERREIHHCKSQNDGCKSKYLLSPRDICSVEILGKLIDSGVKSLKIEGRMKSPEYVATVVRIYRKYIDSFLKAGDSLAHKKYEIESTDIKDLTQIFNRGGFSTGYLEGKKGRDMMCYEKPKNWGVYLGEIISYDKSAKTADIRLKEDLSIGDGIEVWNGEDESPGTVVSEIKCGGRKANSAKAGETAVVGSLKGRIFKGNKVYRTSEKRLNITARESFAGRSGKKTDISCSIKLRAAEPVMLTVKDNAGNEAVVKGDLIPEAAVNRPISEERIREQLSKTGATPFNMVSVEIHMDPGITLPISEINNIRRKALEEIELKRAQPIVRKISKEEEEIKNKLLYFPGNSRNKSGDVKISLYFHTWRDDIDYTMLNADRLYFPFAAFLNEKTREMLGEMCDKNREIFAWLPSITRGNYDNIIRSRLDELISGYIDGILVGNMGLLDTVKELRDLKVMGDYPLNVFNSFSITELAEKKLSGITLSPELNLGQIGGLSLPAQFSVEAIAYGRITVMTSEYCPVGSISGGQDTKSRCSEVCTGRMYKLKDRMGMEFPVLCDRIDCRSTILNSNVIFVPESLHKIKAAGVDTLRLIISDEQTEDIIKLVDMHRDAANIGTKALVRYEAIIEKIKTMGFTKGHYFRGV